MTRARLEHGYNLFAVSALEADIEIENLDLPFRESGGLGFIAQKRG